jgi:hypothetical protein
MQGLAPVPSHTDALMRSTLAACAAVDVNRVGAVLEVIPTGCRQGSLQLLGPFLVGLGEPPHLIGSQAKVTEHRAERLAVVDRVDQARSVTALCSAARLSTTGCSPTR